MNHRAILTVFLVLLMPLATASPALRGHWSGQVSGQSLAVSFDGQGRGTVDGRPVRYETKGATLWIEDSGDVAIYQFQVSGNQLTVVGGDLPGRVTLQRGSAAARPTQNSPTGSRAELVGRWCKVSSFSANAGGGSQSSACFELRNDGSYSYGAESSLSAQAPGMWGGTSSSSEDAGRWSATPQTITAHSQSGSVTTYRLEKRNHPRNRDPMLCLDGVCYVTHWQKAPWN